MFLLGHVLNHESFLVGGFKYCLFSISYMGCHPQPIDEVHDFSRWFGGTTKQIDPLCWMLDPNVSLLYPLVNVCILPWKDPPCY